MKFNKKNDLREVHKITPLGDAEEFYPLTNQKLIRPDINFKVAFLKLFAALSVCAIITVLVYFFTPLKQSEFPTVWKIVIPYFVLLFITVIIFIKPIIFFCIRIYQRYAPYDIRSSCVFIPCCSEYMILAIEKYGLVKGIKKGINRLNRCHYPNGGEDYP